MESVLVIETMSPRGHIDDESEVFVALEPVSSVELGETTQTACEPVNG